MRGAGVLCVLAAGALPRVAAGDPLTERLEWVDQVGVEGPVFDQAGHVVAEGEDVYVAGRSGPGALPGQVEVGGGDAWLRRYAVDGAVVWTRQFGTDQLDTLAHVAVGDGGVLVAGTTLGTFPGQVSAGWADVFLAWFDRDGTLLSASQFGTDDLDLPLDVVVYEGEAYLVGVTYGAFPGQASLGEGDLFVARVGADGSLRWVDQFGTADDDPAIFWLGGIVADAEGVTVGSSLAGPGSPVAEALAVDGVLRHYDLDGALLGEEVVGTGCADLVTDLVRRDGVLYVAGTSEGDMTAAFDPTCDRASTIGGAWHDQASAFVQAREADGAVAWTWQVDAEAHAIDDGAAFSLGRGVAVDADAVVLTAELSRSMAAIPPSPRCPVFRGIAEDVLVQALSLDGAPTWTQVLGTRGRDSPVGVALTAGSAVVGGATDCPLLGAEALGGVDGFLLSLQR